jgi:hypothetical protein
LYPNLFNTLYGQFVLIVQIEFAGIIGAQTGTKNSRRVTLQDGAIHAQPQMSSGKAIGENRIYFYLR